MEYWSDGPKSDPPLLLYSNTPFRSSASVIFFTSLQTNSCSNFLEDA
jgi:hypothetical protein